MSFVTTKTSVRLFVGVLSHWLTLKVTYTDSSTDSNFLGAVATGRVTL